MEIKRRSTEMNTKRISRQNSLGIIGISLMVSAQLCAQTTCNDEPFKDGSIQVATVAYYKPYPVPAGDPQCSSDNKTCHLSGWLYYPKQELRDAKPRPAIVYNHGHNQQRGEPCAIVKYFTGGLGYIVFAPLRRGHTGPGIQNTGTYIDTDALRFFLAGPQESEVLALEDQYREVREAVAFLGMLPMVNPDRIALMGHSFGGSLTVFASEFQGAAPMGPAPKAAISISGAALEWDDNSSFRTNLRLGAALHKIPLAFIQPLNEISIQPTLVLTNIARSTDPMSAGMLFPPVLPIGDECTRPIPDPACVAANGVPNH
jgi:dienelactone hydrolase